MQSSGQKRRQHARDLAEPLFDAGGLLAYRGLRPAAVVEDAAVPGDGGLDLLRTGSVARRGIEVAQGGGDPLAQGALVLGIALDGRDGGGALTIQGLERPGEDQRQLAVMLLLRARLHRAGQRVRFPFEAGGVDAVVGRAPDQGGDGGIPLPLVPQPVDRRTIPDRSRRQGRDQNLRTGPVGILRIRRSRLGRRKGGRACDQRHGQGSSGDGRNSMHTENDGNTNDPVQSEPLRKRGSPMDHAGRRIGAAMIAGFALGLALGFTGAGAASARTLVLDLELEDSSGEPQSAEHAERLKRVSAELRRALDAKGYDVIDDATTAGLVPPGTRILTCNGCETDIARAAGADLVVFGVVRKVSSLILWIAVAVEDVGTGREVTTVRGDIRGDNAASWSRGVAWLVEHRLAEHAPAKR